MFSLNKIYEVPEDEKNIFFNYKYFLQQTQEHELNIKPSFASFDRSLNEIMIGTFVKCSNQHVDIKKCQNIPESRLEWVDIKGKAKTSFTCGPFFSEMQGAATLHPNSAKGKVILTSSSYGRKYKLSLIHI